MIKRFILFLAIGVLAANVSGQIDRSRAPQPDPAPEIRIGDYKTFTLKNGLKIFLVENHKIPRVAYSLVLEMDPFTEGDSMGYSSFAGELLGTATSSKTKEEIDEAVDYIGATISTGSGSLYGASLKKHNEVLLGLMSDILLNPVFQEEELEKVKKQTLSSLAFNRNDPSAISDEVADVLFYSKEHPYGEVMTEASVNSVTTTMCEEYYRTWFRPNIAYLAIVGDLNLKEAKKLVKKYFGPWGAGEVPDYEYTTPQAPDQLTITLVDRPHAVQSVIKVGYPVELTVGDEEYIKARVMNVLLGGGSYRLFQNLRETHGYTYGAYSSLNQDKYVGNFQATADVRNEVTDSAVYQILYEMKRLQKELVPVDELDMVKNYLTGTFSLALENPATVASFAQNIARYNLPSDYYANYLKAIAAVTPEDVQQMALRYMKPENAYVLVVGKADEIAGGLAALSPDNTVNYYDVEGNYIDPATMVKALPAGLTAENVIEKYLEATGGREVLESITDQESDMFMEMQGMPIQMKVYRKAPDMMNITVSMNGTVLSKTLFDGESGSTSGMQGAKTLEGEELEAMKSEAIFMPELDYAGNGFEVALLSVETIGNSETYKVEIKDPSGGLSEEYYDIETGLKIRTDKILETPNGTMVQTTLLSDYRNVDGVLFPYKMEVTMGPQAFTGTVKSIRFNAGMDESVFK